MIDLSTAGLDWARGEEVDYFSAGLSVIGLGSTAATVATGGTSYTIKIGASVLKLARKLTLLSPRLIGILTDAARRGIRWNEVAKFDTLSDQGRILRPGVFRPFLAVSSDLGRMNARLGARGTLHMMRFVDGPAESSRIAIAAERMGMCSIAAMAVLGKSRFMKATLRWGDEVIGVIAGLVSFLTALTLGLFAGLIGGGEDAFLRRLAKGPAENGALTALFHKPESLCRQGLCRFGSCPPMRQEWAVSPAGPFCAPPARSGPRAETARGFFFPIKPVFAIYPAIRLSHDRTVPTTCRAIAAIPHEKDRI
ncbi:hypothetical protein [Pseudogemmobacter bohemicus]|uniref:hypothetical protein n=1 Tax=Pseudogemmobacter bohemicus TaxID=2250708 RepID=UPI000DD4B4A5|nr:hypothetical protein [Pseudogemmobacter bohemicus]